jgi:hypothetical protein
MGTFAAQCMCGQQDDYGTDSQLELFAHITRFFGFKVVFHLDIFLNCGRVIIRDKCWYNRLCSWEGTTDKAWTLTTKH